MDKIVAILRNVARDRGRGLVGQLNPKAIVEGAAEPVAMIWTERQGEICGLRAVAMDGPEHGRKQVAAEIRSHVPACFVLSNGVQFRPLEPAQQIII